MNPLATVTALTFIAAGSLSLFGATLTAPPAVLFGRVIHAGEGPSYQAYEGELTLELVSDSDPTHVISLSSKLSRIGAAGDISYRFEIPLKYLPAAHELPSSLAVGFQELTYSFRSLLIDGRSALLLIPSHARLTTRFSELAPEHRLDLLVNLPQTDSDADRIPDWWEQRHGLNPHLASDAARDLDGDGLDNRGEWVKATDPTVPNITPLLQTSSLRVAAGGVAGFHVAIVDLDTAPSELSLRLLDIPDGLTFHRDAVVSGEGDALSYADVLDGRVQIDVAETFVSGSLILSVRDGTASGTVTGAVAVVAFSPVTAAGITPAAWLRAGSLETPSSVAEWTDQSGNQRDAYQPAPASQPRVNDHSDPGVRFERNAFLFLDDRELNTSQSTVFVAFKPEARHATPQTILRLGQLELAIGDLTHPVYHDSLRFTGGGRVLRGPAIVPGASEQLTLSAGAAGTYLRSAAGYAAYSTDPPRNLLNDPVFPTIGGTRSIHGNTATALFDGLVHEVVIYDQQLGADTIASHEDYLESQWGNLTVWDFRDQTVPLMAKGHAAARNALTGGWGNDSLTGGALSDVLRGGPGDDRLTGLDGADRFQFFREQGKDTVTDFEPAEGDVLDLTGIFGGRAGNASDYIRVRRITTRLENTLPRSDSILELDYDGPANGWTTHQTITLENHGLAQLGQPAIAKLLWLGGPVFSNSSTNDGTVDPPEDGTDAGRLEIHFVSERLELSLLAPKSWSQSNLIVEHSSDLRAWADVTSTFTAVDTLLGTNILQRTYTANTNSPPASPGFYRILARTLSQP